MFKHEYILSTAVYKAIFNFVYRTNFLNRNKSIVNLFLDIFKIFFLTNYYQSDVNNSLLYLFLHTVARVISYYGIDQFFLINEEHLRYIFLKTFTGGKLSSRDIFPKRTLVVTFVVYVCFIVYLFNFQYSVNKK